MEVYLTFDDGIQAGTEEVLTVLKETGVRATFFLTGIQLCYSYKKDRVKCLELLKDIYENHVIGNHSFSHANDYYSDYYQQDGVQIDNEGSRRPVLLDFEKGKDQINHYLGMIYGETAFSKDYPLAKNQQKPLARLPGRNSWYLSDRLSYCEADTQASAAKLFRAGYEIFGWNTEWQMSFDFYRDTIALKTKNTHPYHDMYAAENLGKDRLTENMEAVRNKVLKTAINDKVIVLMHDRAFRKGTAAYSVEADKLKALINDLQNIKMTFKTLDDYIR